MTEEEKQKLAEIEAITQLNGIYRQEFLFLLDLIKRQAEKLQPNTEPPANVIIPEDSGL